RSADQKHHERENDDGVGEDDQIAPEHAHYMREKRHTHLENDTFRSDESGAALTQRRREEVPHDDAGAKIRQELGQWRTEQGSEHSADGCDEHRRVQGQPEGTDARAAVALGYILPAKRMRYTPYTEGFSNVAQGDRDTSFAGSSGSGAHGRYF